MLFYDRTAGNIAPVPERTLGREKAGVAELFHSCHGVDDFARSAQRWHVVVYDRLMVVVVVGRQQNLRFDERVDCAHIVGHLLLETFVYPLKTNIGKLWGQAAVYKGRAVDDGHYIFAEKPFSVFAFSAQRTAQREVACGERAIELGTQGLGITVISFSPGHQPALTDFRGLFARECSVFLLADVTQVTDHVHGFVITD